MLLQTLGNRHEGPHKHSGIPAILTAIHVLEGPFKIWLLHEPLRLKKRGLVTLHPLWRRQWFPDMNVSVTSGGFSRLDANGHNHLPARGQIKGVDKDLLKFFLLRDDMVSR